MIHLDSKARTVKFVEENVRGNLHNFSLWQLNTETQTIKEKTDHLNVIKIKSSSILKS